jgi:hypothetical protein
LPASFLKRFGAALRCQCDDDDRLVCVYVSERDADAWRLDDVDGVDADARADWANVNPRLSTLISRAGFLSNGDNDAKSHLTTVYHFVAAAT